MIIVTEIDRASPDCEHLSYHKFPLPKCGEPGFYRQVSSFNWYFNGSKKRNHNKHLIYYAQDESEKFFPPIKSVPMFIHENIWEFYKAIGYDHKKNKYDKKIH